MYMMWITTVVTFVSSVYLLPDIYGSRWADISPSFWVLSAVMALACMLTESAFKYLPNDAGWFGIFNTAIYALGTLGNFILIFFVVDMNPESLFHTASLTTAGVLLLSTAIIAIKGEKEHMRQKYAPVRRVTKPLSVQNDDTHNIAPLPVEFHLSQTCKGVSTLPPTLKDGENIKEIESSQLKKREIVAPPIFKLEN